MTKEDERGRERQVSRGAESAKFARRRADRRRANIFLIANVGSSERAAQLYRNKELNPLSSHCCYIRLPLLG